MPTVGTIAHKFAKSIFGSLKCQSDVLGKKSDYLPAKSDGSVTETLFCLSLLPIKKRTTSARRQNANFRAFLGSELFHHAYDGLSVRLSLGQPCSHGLRASTHGRADTSLEA